jgi:hypothetical protein
VPQGSLTVRELRSAEASFGLSSPGDDLIAPTFSQESKSVAFSAYDHRAGMYRVHVLRPGSGEELLAFPAGKMTPAGAALDPTGKRLAVALTPRSDSTESASLVTWRIDQNKEDPTFKKVTLPALPARRPRFESQVYSPLVYSPDGGLLARVVLGDFRQSVQLYDGITGAERLNLGVGGMAIPPAFSPDGRTLAVASGNRSLDHTVTLWELRTGKMRWSGLLPATPTALAFAPAGHLLVSGHSNATALVWDVTGQYATGKVRTAGQYQALWEDLANGGAMTAFAAQRSLAADRDRAVEALRQRLKPAEGKSLDDATLAKLVQQLDDDDPDTRQKARAALEQQRWAAETALGKAMEGKPSAELKQSASALLARLNQPLQAGEERAALRALEVLEWVGTPAARQLIEELAHGWAAAELTRDAKATLARLRR